MEIRRAQGKLSPERESESRKYAALARTPGYARWLQAHDLLTEQHLHEKEEELRRLCVALRQLRQNKNKKPTGGIKCRLSGAFIII
jgi:hypothetical protein